MVVLRSFFIPAINRKNNIIVVEYDENKGFEIIQNEDEYLNRMVLCFNKKPNWIHQLQSNSYYTIYLKCIYNINDSKIYSSCHLCNVAHFYESTYYYLHFKIHNEHPKFLFYINGRKSEDFFYSWANRDCFLCRHFVESFINLGKFPLKCEIVCGYQERDSFFGTIVNCKFFKYDDYSKIEINDNDKISCYIGQKFDKLSIIIN